MVIIIQNGVNEESVVGSIEVAASGINEEKYYWVDDFDYEAAAVNLAAGGLRADEYTTDGNNGSDDDVTFIQDQGGVIKFATDGLDNDSIEISTTNAVFNTGSNLIMEVRFQVDNIGANDLGAFFGFTETSAIQSINDIIGVSDDFFVVGMNSDTGTPALVKCYSEDDNGGLISSEFAGITLVANQWCTVRIDLTDTEQPRVWVNVSGGAILPTHEIPAATLASHTIQDNIYVKMVMFVQSLDAGNSEGTMSVDYVKIWQDRS